MFADNPEGHAPFDLERWLPIDAAAMMRGRMTRRRFAAGVTIYGQSEPGDHLFRVVSGSVRLSVIAADGRRLLYLLFGPGDCFGESSLIDGGVRPHTAEAVEATELQILCRAALGEVRAAHPSFDNALLQLVSRHMRLMSAFFSDAELNDLPSRIASRILVAAQAFGRTAAAGAELSLALPQAELAAMVGVSRQSANKILQRFRLEGLISLEYGALVIRDLARLEHRAAGLSGPSIASCSAEGAGRRRSPVAAASRFSGSFHRRLT